LRGRAADNVQLGQPLDVRSRRRPRTVALRGGGPDPIGYLLE